MKRTELDEMLNDEPSFWWKVKFKLVCIRSELDTKARKAMVDCPEEFFNIDEEDILI